MVVGVILKIHSLVRRVLCDDSNLRIFIFKNLSTCNIYEYFFIIFLNNVYFCACVLYYTFG